MKFEFEIKEFRILCINRNFNNWMQFSLYRNRRVCVFTFGVFRLQVWSKTCVLESVFLAWQEEIVVLAKIIKRCIKLMENKRLTMKQVEIELQSYSKTKIQRPPCANMQGLLVSKWKIPLLYSCPDTEKKCSRWS